MELHLLDDSPQEVITAVTYLQVQVTSALGLQKAEPVFVLGKTCVTYDSDDCD